MGMLGGLVKPITNMADKSSKANKVKSVKLKVKFDKDKPKPPADGKD